MQNTREESGITEDADFFAVKKIYEVKELVGQASNVLSPEEAWNKVYARINRKHHFSITGYWRYAAAVIGIIMTIGWFAGQNIHSYFSDPEQFTSISAPLDKIKNVILPDGTDVWLNYGSTLKYSNRFGKTNRYIIVDGEVFLKVVKDSRNPFTVSVGNSKVIVHGTTFNVKNYSSGNTCEVVLVEGSVAYVNSQKNIFIVPGERISEDKTSGDLVVDQVDAEKYTSWTSGKVYFDNQPLHDLVTLLEQWYAVDFEFANDKAKTYTFTGMINREQSLDYTLQIIEMTNKVKFIKKGGKMLITN